MPLSAAQSHFGAALRANIFRRSQRFQQPEEVNLPPVFFIDPLLLGGIILLV